MMSDQPMPPYQWQQAVWSNFYRQVTGNTLAHALLITGAPGTGLEKLGLAMAHYLLCRSPLEDRACGQCKACQLISAGSHPDLQQITPEEAGKAIKIDQIRSLTEFVSKTAQQGGRKVVVLQPAEAMNANAANSLLKCLEEPAGDTVLLLVCYETGRLMPTIRSRCSTLMLAAPDRKHTLEWLNEMGVEQGERLLAETGNAPLTALDWWQNDTLGQRRKMCEALIALTEGRMTTSALVNAWSAIAPLDVVNTLVTWVEHLIRGRRHPDGLPASWADLGTCLERVPEQLLFRYRDALCQRKGQLNSGSNLNATLVIEELLLDWRALTASGRLGSRARA